MCKNEDADSLPAADGNLVGFAGHAEKRTTSEILEKLFTNFLLHNVNDELRNTLVHGK